MTIPNKGFIRSLRNEAGRQADFFERRDPETAALWRCVESAAHRALIDNDQLCILLASELTKYPIIKPCE